MLRTKVAVVTGGARGIGLALSKALVDHGASVVMMGRDAETLEKAATDLGEQAFPMAVDISEPEAVRAAFARIDERFATVDILVNNAAIGWPHRIEQVTDEELRIEVGTNVLGPIHTIRSAVPLLRRSTDPHIVNISSDSTRDPFPYLLVYAATKSALETLSKGLAAELRPDGIRVTLLMVGQTEGGEFRFHWDADRRAEAEGAWEALGYKQRVSGGPVGQPAERVAEALVYAVTRPRGSVVGEITVRAHSGVTLDS